jgi:hypothetical protein
METSANPKNYAFGIFNQFIVSLSAPCFNALHLNYIYWGGVPATPTVQLNSFFSAKTDPRENPEKNPDKLFD